MELTRRSLIVQGGMASGALAFRATSTIAARLPHRRRPISPRLLLPAVTRGSRIWLRRHHRTFARQGHEVVLLYLNDGAWPPTPAATRLAEAKRACELLRARPSYAGQTNGAAIVDNFTMKTLPSVSMPRRPTPSLLIGWWTIIVTIAPSPCSRTMRGKNPDGNSRSIITKYRMEKTRCSFPQTATSILPGWNRVRKQRVTRTPARRRTATMGCRTRYHASGAWKAATREPKPLSGNSKVPWISSLIR